jgi:hypothetical protein
MSGTGICVNYSNQLAQFYTVDIILNELSLKPLAATAAQAGTFLDSWLKLVDEVSLQLGQQPIFRTPTSFLHLQVSDDGYLFVQWFDNLPFDEQSRVLAAVAQAPFTRGSYPEYIFHDSSPANFYGRECHGFAYAIENECLSWSLDTNNQWYKPQYEIVRNTIDEEDYKEVEEVMQVWHLPLTGLTQAHQPFLSAQLSAAEQKLIQSCRTGTDLLRVWSAHFSHLDLTDEAARTLPKVPPAALPAVIRILIELQSFYNKWNGIPVNYETALRYKATQESSSRLKAYAAELTINCPDGETRLMNWHLRYTIGAGRLYFLPNEAQRRCFIGYVGIKIGAE